MTYPVLAAATMLVGACSFPSVASDLTDERDRLEFFESKIRPVLVHECYGCHSNEAAQQGKLRGELKLDTRDASLQGGESGPAIVPGRPSESLLLSALRHESFEMPPKGKLSDETIADFEKWIVDGAVDPRQGLSAPKQAGPDIEGGRSFWSFQPVRRPDFPISSAVKIEGETDFPFSWVDQLISQRLRGANLQRNPLADARTLVRRAWFDLLGLPPSPKEMETWVTRLQTPTTHSASSINALQWSALIDQLLQSPHYGERQARHWMDVARFAESYGYEQDYDRPNAYHYRDFLIRAFNQDIPYDRFIHWQLAGDELASDEPLAWMATGFLSGGAFPTQLTEAEFESTRYDELDDMVATTGVAFLGLSVGCARCHDHKFDPIPTSDYYRLAATFTSTIRSEKQFDLPTSSDQSADQNTKQASSIMVASEGLPILSHHANDRGYPHFYPVTYQLRRGDVQQKGEPASAGFLQVLTSADSDITRWQSSAPLSGPQSHRRSALARWITDTDQGAGNLAARVMANRVWQHHFGQGLVATPNDFGASGERPTHPELLDYLASELIDGEWRLKQLHKTIMTSGVYMQASFVAADDPRLTLDRENRFYWRREPRRLEAEAIRDAMLLVSGELDRTMYGPGSLDPNMKRRSVYFFIKRSQLIPMMMLFDWPEHLVSIGQRTQTTIAPQALMFMNSPAGRSYADALARRFRSGTHVDRITQIFEIVLGRKPTLTELAATTQFLDRQTELHRTAGKEQPAGLALTDLCQMMLSMNEFMYID